MKNLAFLRKSKGYTQQEMANILQVSKPTYNHYETGRYEPDIKTIIKIADFFDCSIDYLVGHQTKSLIYNDFSKDQQKAISMLKKLDEKETAMLLGYLARITDTPIDEIINNKKEANNE